MTTAKSVVITGASSRIGRVSALRLAAAGFRVFAGVRKEADARSLRAERPAIEPIMIDVADAASIAARAQLASTLEGLDGLVNNAGMGTMAPLEYARLDQLRQQFEVNVIGQIAVRVPAAMSLQSWAQTRT